MLQPIGGDQFLVAADVEPGTRGNRLELLAVVRGLEALEQPSRVTLLTRSRYVNRGIRRGLSQWRERKWRWERFGQLVPIRDRDLWQRVDRALEFHRVECCPAPFEEETHCATEKVVVSAMQDIPAAETASPELASPELASRSGVAGGGGAGLACRAATGVRTIRAPRRRPARAFFTHTEQVAAERFGSLGRIFATGVYPGRMTRQNRTSRRRIPVAVTSSLAASNT